VLADGTLRARVHVTETRNEKSGYAASFSDDAAAARYDDQYRPGTFDSHVHELQVDWLRRLCRRYFAEPPIHVDFACGTGRIIEALQREVRASIGYDVSEAMLNRARRRCPNARFVKLPDGGPIEPVAVDGPVLATMFRLILNAEPETRDSGCRFIAETISAHPGSIAVVNNHGNSRSLRHLARFRRRRTEWFNELSDAEARQLFARHGLEVVETFGVGHLTPRAYRTPAWLRSQVERINALLSGRFLAGFAADICYVLRAQSTDRPSAANGLGR
jgi:hypothetical protein